MSNETELTTFISQLDELKQTNDHLKIGQNLDHRYDSQIKEILEKWTSKENLTSKEERFLDLYSSLQLNLVERYFLLYNPTNDDGNLVQIFRKCLYRVRSINILKETVVTIRDEQKLDDENERILLFVMRMIDARTLAYRLCFKDLNPPPNELNEELIDCLNHREMKHFLHDMREFDNQKANATTIWSKMLNRRHQFFVGCCSFAIALFETNDQFLKNDEHKNFICLLVKYVRVTLKQIDFAQNPISLYCLRGILALLTNCVPNDSWMEIINRAFVSPEGHESRQQNPFNEDLFSLIISRLLGSTHLQKGAIQSESCTITSLIDVTLIFLNKWSDDLSNVSNDANDDESALTTETNQLCLFLRSNRKYNGDLNASHIIMPYVDAKYDRLRLMALATLSNIMNYQDFKQFQYDKPQIAEDIVSLIFDFIRRALSNQKRQFKGIHCDRLLCYLLRFLTQDVFKKPTIDQIEILLDLARDRNVYALKVFRRLSSSPELKDRLLDKINLKKFLLKDADILFDCDAMRMKIIDEIRRNLDIQKKKALPTLVNSGGRQAFISYSHKDKEACAQLENALKESNLFTKIWIDRDFVQGDLVDAITSAMNQCQIVFALLSDDYCASDTCRCEWNYAFTKRIKLYPVHVRKEFRRDNYDWVLFYLRDTLYYRLYESDGLTKLVRHLSKMDDNPEAMKPLSRPTSAQISIDTVDFRSPSLRSEVNATITDPVQQNSSRTKPISEWKSDDIRDWCLEKNLHKWISPLANFHGHALIELQKLLSVETHFQYFLNVNELNGFDLALFRCELNLLLSKRTNSKVTSKKRPNRHMQQRKT